MDYKKYKGFRKRLKKIGKITDPVKRRAALSSLTQDMRQNGFDFPIVYHKTIEGILQLLNKQIHKVKFKRRERIWSLIKVLSIIIGIVASIITIISLIL